MQSIEFPNVEFPGRKECIDLSDYCRLCLQLPDESDLLDLQLIYDEEENLSYYECFTICTQLDLRAGGTYAPHQLCKSCGLELQVAYDFHKKVEESKKFLVQFEKSATSNNVVEAPVVTMPSEVKSIQQRYAVEMVEGNVDNIHYETRILPLEPLESGTVPEPLESEITKEEEDVTSHLQTSMEYEELEEQVDMLDEYQSVDELVDEDAETVQIVSDQEECEIREINARDNSHKEAPLASDNKHDEARTINTESNSKTNNDSSKINQLNDNERNVEFFEYTNSDSDFEPTNNTKNKQKSTKVQTQENERASDTPTVDDAQDLNTEVVITKAGNVRKRKRYNGQYSCDYCEKIFKNRSRMLTHRRIHEPDRPKYKCEECGRLYATKQAKGVHMDMVHNMTGLKCTICDKAFAVKKLLDIHMRYHTGDFPYACDLCERKFAQMCHLTTHKNVKHNSERFACEHPGCGKFFTSSSSLRNHEFLHSEMPFECAYCQRGYPSKSKIKVHIRQKHGFVVTLEEIEDMRKFHVMRSKLNLVKITEND